MLIEIGEQNNYDVSDSEKEMYFTRKFSMFEGESTRKHTLTYKPDVVWKKGMKCHAIFEIEYANPKSQIIEKKKYALGTFLLGLIASQEKNCGNFIIVSNSRNLLEELITSWEVMDFIKEDFAPVSFWSFDPSEDKRFRDYVYLKKQLKRYVTEI